ncbi:hypothetical protein GRS66_003488 [Saccharomyces pastorianus]|uniref:Uncharacterized protein n=1 Tax=Saccharomyces pastorianus TaxID=27292 RepID=A0A6C1DX80_SACPS|nr:hypothetical protein GRS66_003488 [Saccharomyces pastorianus]
MDSDLEAFSHNPADGSFAAMPDQTAAKPIIRMNCSLVLSSITIAVTFISRVKLTCLDGLNPAHVPIGGEQSNAYRILLRYDRKTDIEESKAMSL